MSQLSYMRSYRSTLFHLITHTYFKALLFLEFRSIIHSMKTIFEYSPAKSQNMSLIGGLRRGGYYYDRCQVKVQ